MTLPTHFSLACAFQLLIFLSLSIGVTPQADECTTVISDFGCESTHPYECRAPLSWDKWCTNAECCCVSRDETFASVCFDDDICCDGRCCDGKKSFCCGGQCCDGDNETCCRDKCTSRSPAGLRVALPTVSGSLLGIYYAWAIFCGGENRMTWMVLSLPVVIVLGIVHIIVGFSVWDCSSKIKVVVLIGFIYLISGLILLLIAMCVAVRSGKNILSAFVAQRLVYVEAIRDTYGNIISARMVTGEYAIQMQQLLKASNTERGH